MNKRVFNEICNKYGITPEQGKDLLNKYSEGGTVGEPKGESQEPMVDWAKKEYKELTSDLKNLWAKSRGIVDESQEYIEQSYNNASLESKKVWSKYFADNDIRDNLVERGKEFMQLTRDASGAIVGGYNKLDELDDRATEATMKAVSDGYNKFDEWDDRTTKVVLEGIKNMFTGNGTATPTAATPITNKSSTPTETYTPRPNTANDRANPPAPTTVGEGTDWEASISTITESIVLAPDTETVNKIMSEVLKYAPKDQYGSVLSTITRGLEGSGIDSDKLSAFNQIYANRFNKDNASSSDPYNNEDIINKSIEALGFQ
jgi:hypothetical protein